MRFRWAMCRSPFSFANCLAGAIASACAAKARSTFPPFPNTLAAAATSVPADARSKARLQSPFRAWWSACEPNPWSSVPTNHEILRRVQVNVSGSNLRIRTELVLLIAFCGFLFFYGLGAFGLLGADEPRYAQIAREMLDRSDWVTPVLNGKPWLEKPPLYYWQAMLSYSAARAILPGKEDGVTEQTARFPGAIDAALMIAAIYFFLRRFRPSTELDGALITASCAGVIGFAHAAATDM